MPKGVRPLGYTVQGDVIEHEAEAVKAIYRASLPQGPRCAASLRRLAARILTYRRPPLPRHNRTLMPGAERRPCTGVV